MSLHYLAYFLMLQEYLILYGRSAREPDSKQSVTILLG